MSDLNPMQTFAGPASGGSTNPMQGFVAPPAATAPGAPAAAPASANPMQEFVTPAVTNSNPMQSFVGAPAVTPPGAGGGPNLLHQVLGGAGKVVSAIGSLGGEAAKEAVMVPYTLGQAAINAATGSHFGPHMVQNEQGIGNYQDELAFERRFPIVGGITSGLRATGSEIAHPTMIARNYSANPVKAGLNDLGNLALVAGPVGATVKGLAEGGQAARLAAGLDASKGLTAASKVGGGLKAAGDLPSLPFRAARGGLLSLADKAAANPELLHAVDDSLTSAGAAAAGGDQALLQADRQAEILKQAGQRTGVQSALANAGARLDPATQTAVNVAVGAENRLKAILHDPAAYLEQVEGKGASQRIAGLSLEEARGTLQKEVIQKGTGTLLKNPAVERVSDVDLASLEAAASAAHTSVQRYIQSMGFTDLQTATNGLVKARNAFIPNNMADQLARVLETPNAPGVAGSILGGANRLAMVSKLGLSPITVVNRVGHAVLGSAVNPNIKESARLAWAAARHKLPLADTVDLAANTTMVKHGAVWQAGLKTEAENPSRVQAITSALVNAPATIMEKSPFLRAARAADDATRSGVWLAARHAGASPEEADLLLGRTGGYFDRSTNLQRGLTKAIPFYNWHKQVGLVFEHMAEERPVAFSQFVNAAARMADSNQAQGITGSNTRLGGFDVNLSSVDPFSGVGAGLKPQSLLGPAAKAIWPIVTGVGTSGYQTSSPSGALVGGGAQQFPASIQELIKTLPQLQALQGSAPRYGTGDVRPNAQGGGALQTASRLFGLETVPTSVTQATTKAIQGAAARDAKTRAAKDKKYQSKLAASGQDNSLFSNLP